MFKYSSFRCLWIFGGENRFSATVNSLLTDTSLRRTPAGVGPCSLSVILLFCTSSTDVYSLRKGSALQYYCRSHIIPTLYKPDTSVSQGRSRRCPSQRELSVCSTSSTVRKQLMDYATPPLVLPPPLPREMTSEEREQKFHPNYASLSRFGQYF